MSHSFIQNCCGITASFTTSGMNSWTLLLYWRCYHPYFWSAASRQCPPISAFAAPLGLSYHSPRHTPKTLVQVTCRQQSS